MSLLRIPWIHAYHRRTASGRSRCGNHRLCGVARKDAWKTRVGRTSSWWHNARIHYRGFRSYYTRSHDNVLRVIYTAGSYGIPNNRVTLHVPMGRWQSGQLQRTVNPPTKVYEGSNPSLPNLQSISHGAVRKRVTGAGTSSVAHQAGN